MECPVYHEIGSQQVNVTGKDQNEFIELFMSENKKIVNNHAVRRWHGYYWKECWRFTDSFNLLENCCRRWGLEVNTDTTKVMVFRKRGDLLHNEKWLYKTNVLDVVSNFNYLGTVFNYTGTFVMNQETLVEKGLKALNILLYNTKRFW